MSVTELIAFAAWLMWAASTLVLLALVLVPGPRPAEPERRPVVTVTGAGFTICESGPPERAG